MTSVDGLKAPSFFLPSFIASPPYSHAIREGVIWSLSRVLHAV
jgi:hypothetical protein